MLDIDKNENEIIDGERTDEEDFVFSVTKYSERVESRE